MRWPTTATTATGWDIGWASSPGVRGERRELLPVGVTFRDTPENASRWKRWYGLAVLYRYAPSRSHARMRWVTWGAIGATVLWVLASFLFQVYTANFANYSATYGSLGAVIALLMWLWVSAFVVLLGAKLNADKMEHQTRKDTTTGPEKPLGERGAYVADDVGKSCSDPPRQPGRAASVHGVSRIAVARFPRPSPDLTLIDGVRVAPLRCG